MFCLAALLVCAQLAGCSRRHYRMRADRDVYRLLGEHTAGTPWQIPDDYSVYPTPDSRLADPTDPDWPCLPSPGPVLYVPGISEDANSSEAEELPLPPATPLSSVLRKLPPVPSTGPRDAGVRLASFVQPEPPEPGDLPIPTPGVTEEDLSLVGGRSSVQPIPAEYWNSIPDSCLQRMLEFESVRAEYRREYSATEWIAAPESSEGWTLAEIVELARRNSRSYQSEKEQLYSAALAVSLLRYEYELKFSPFGNGADVNYLHSRFDGETVNTLGIPSSFQIEKTFATGAQFLARFANDVLLTYNGPDGFSYDVGSELLFDFTQQVLQRDILLEPITQAERDLVYAARDFIRFRKEFFFDLASQYYNILRIYRNIEIDSQNYFSLVRTVRQAQSEVLAGVQNAPNQVAVDQFEQSLLSGRRNVIETCNQLERALDQLKLAMGLPTEQTIDINLTELEQLTLQDEIEVAAERVQRWRRRVEQQRDTAQVERGELLNADVFLTERLLEWVQLRQRLDPDTPPPQELSDLFVDFRIDQAVVEVERNRRELARASDPAIPQPVILLYRRTTDVVSAQIELARRQLQKLQSQSVSGLESYRERLRAAEQRQEEQQASVAQILQGEQVELDRLLADAERLLADVDQLVDELWRLLGQGAQPTEQQRLEETIGLTDRLLSTTEQLMANSQMGLPEVELEVTDAMLTALVQRLDLMNERGLLADSWRRVKLAGDDLRSVLNLSASHSLRTDRNLPFDFDFDDSRTDVRLSLDLPLNRRAQRNRYRESLIRYQAQRRQLMQFEDTIKFEIRDELRNLQQNRVQYPISVTQAALAAEQAISVQLQLDLGIQSVRETDLLDALQASREALSAVANSRIGYLVQRARFILDLELMQLDESGYWPQINDPDYQPIANTIYPANAGPTYGRLSTWVKPSKLMYHLYHHPLPGQQITLIREPSANDQQATPVDEETAPIELLPVPSR